MSYYKDKLQHHLDKAEHHQRTVAAIEDAALRTAAKESERRPRADRSTLPIEYAAAVLLENNFAYKSACSSRNAHQAQVQMYLAAILGGLDN
jgi:hypothetical protein